MNNFDSFFREMVWKIRSADWNEGTKNILVPSELINRLIKGCSISHSSGDEYSFNELVHPKLFLSTIFDNYEIWPTFYGNRSTKIII